MDLKNKYIVGDCVEVLSGIDDNTFDMCWTSPPYKDEDGFSINLINNIALELYRVLKDKSVAFVNFGTLADYKSRPFKVALSFEDVGFNFKETFILIKNKNTPIQGSVRVDNFFEYMFMFSKGKMPKINRLAVGMKYMDKGNIQRFERMRDLKCRGNVWPMNYVSINKSYNKVHKDRCPLHVPEDCIKLLKNNFNQDSIVVDPFFGSGTVGRAALNQGVNYFGIDKNKEYMESSEKWFNMEKPYIV